MSNSIHKFTKLMVVSLAPVILAACSAVPEKPIGSDAVREKLIQLQSDSELASRAQLPIQEAELAVDAAEKPRLPEDMELGRHLVYMADRKVDTALYFAQARLLEDQRKLLAEQRATARLDSRTREVEDLQRQIEKLNAKKTERGLVITLGDILFDTGKDTFKGGAIFHIVELATFLNEHPDRTVIIEGHTDNVGSKNLNYGLSQRRANSVMAYLVRQGVAPDRIVAYGKGEDFPISDNDTEAGRQQNRRVEVIISDPTLE
ncbi:OmpA family protein [Nitrosomonas supralitoralis]|uniref:OmpA-like domain-containing protein n=1 Tax=Nitrosomonas supralitoralis TaxID=2116706 RepID=A0A2P7NRD7_9PROT|nr:OmpA family protein [Nitrosomonas supralitoralis]PSJ15999.1 hypothetical protein C7H79_15965 [Nitrosomonas supralitoralis]